MVALLDGFDSHMQQYHTYRPLPASLMLNSTSSTVSSKIPASLSLPSPGQSATDTLGTAPLLVSWRTLSPRSSSISGLGGANVTGSVIGGSAHAALSSNGGGASSPRSPPTRAQTQTLATNDAAALFRTPINHVFAGIMSSILQCHQCGSRSSKDELFLDISLSIANRVGGGSSGTTALPSSSKTTTTNQDTLSEGVTTNDCDNNVTIASHSCIAGVGPGSLVDLHLLDCLREFTAKETLSEQVVRMLVHTQHYHV